MPEFVVLAKAEGSDRELICSDQREAAEGCGFTVLEFSVDAPTRGFARAAWDSQRSGRPIDYSSPASDNDWGLENLTDPERTAMVSFVTALVSHDRAALEAAGAYDWGMDPYEWTQDHGPSGRVELIVPPGDPRHWSGGLYRFDDGGAAVIVHMWTAQEGPSDLSLELNLNSSDDDVLARFENLHVM